ncbi:hypothetical protein HK098_008328 [Nowakowskiella sp. JEL0407]|nr:hypothetical protein HK098_008328 [Nowakowskiella sp. JEL0407]
MSAITLTDNMPSGSVCPFKPAAKKDFSSEEEISSGFFDDRLYEGMTGCPFKPAAKKNDDGISGGFYENEDEMYESMENLTMFLKYIAAKKYQEALELSEEIPVLKSDPDNLLMKDYIPILKDRILLDKEMKTWENDSIDSDDLDDLNDLKLDDDDDEDSSSSDDESLDANDDGNSSSSKEESEENSSVDESESDYDV